MTKTSRTKNTIINVSTGLLLTVVTALSGLILPRLIIPCYGSSVNGLVSTITQFLSYISLLEAGVGGVIRAALYKPLAQNDLNNVSGIIKAAQVFYRRIGSIFIVYIVLLCIIFPLVIARDYPPIFVVAMILILSFGTFLQYFVSLPYVALINADQHARICSVTEIVTLLINIGLVYLLIKIGSGILIVKLLSCLVFATRPIFYSIYVKRHYKLDKSVESKNDSIKQRWNGLAHHIAFFIHHNTDIAVISTFIGFTAVSVYSVNYAVVAGVEKVVVAISTGLSPSLGNILVTENKQKVNEVFGVIEFVQTFITTVLFTTTSMLISPFICIYTRTMTDAEYNFPFFAQLIVLSEAIYCIRLIYSTTALSANKYKETQIGAIVECVTNIVLSVILVSQFGMIGVAIGTVVAMIIRCLFDVVFLSKNVVFRPIRYFVKSVVVSISVSSLSIVLCKLLISYNVETAFDWCVCGIKTIFIIGFIAALFAGLFYRKECSFVLSKFAKR